MMSTSTITLLSKPGCVQCTAVETRLKNAGVDYEKIDVSQDPEWLDKLEEAGVRSVPVTVQGDTWVQGFDPDAIDRLF